MSHGPKKAGKKKIGGTRASETEGKWRIAFRSTPSADREGDSKRIANGHRKTLPIKGTTKGATSMEKRAPLLAGWIIFPRQNVPGTEAYTKKKKGFLHLKRIRHVHIYNMRGSNKRKGE